MSGPSGWYAFTPWVWPVLASAVFISGLSIHLWRRRDTPGARPLSLSGFLIALLCLVVAAEISTTDPLVLDLWFMVGDALVLPAAILALVFALDYAGLGHHLTRRVRAVLIGSVAVRLALLAVDAGRLSRGEAPLVGGIGHELGPLGGIFGAYGLAILLVATGVFVVLFIRSPAHRLPVALILVGQTGVRVAYLLGSTITEQLEVVLLTVLAFDLLALMYVIALTRLRLFDLLPVARDTIVERMPDAMVVLDRHDHIAELNLAAEALLDARSSVMRGRPVQVALSSWPALVSALAAPGGTSAEVTVEAPEGHRSWQVGVTPLSDWRGSPIGRLVVLHDITDLRRAEARLLQHERALTAVHEREHLARDLHDTMGQVLAYMGMQADAARQLLSDGRVLEADGALVRLADVARESHRDLRRYIAELNAGEPQGRPLGDALGPYLKRFGDRYGIRPALRVDGPVAELPNDEQLHVFRIIQEALGNVGRHASAGSVQVGLEVDACCLHASIEDDGHGFDVAAPHAEGYGLRFMRERAEELGGRLEVRSRPGGGTRVVLEVPSNGAGVSRPTTAGELVPAGAVSS